MAYTTIDDPAIYFNTKLYTGTGSSLANTGVGFQPDLTWIKGRSGATEHVLTDSVRGVTKELSSNDDGAEETVAQGLTAFGSDGFTVGTDGSYNTSSATYAAWNWKGGTTSGIATNGSTTITPSAYSFNQTAGFSTLAYTGNQTSGAKLAHGLGVKPDMVITKSRAGASGWGVYHKSLGATYGMLLNTTAAKDDDATAWNDVEPDTVNITLGSSINTNKTGTCVGYAFAEKQGYSKFSSYVGNGNADGKFIYLGFRPAFIMWKGTASTQNWMLVDNKRDVSNLSNGLNDVAFPNSSQVPNDGETFLDVLSNGFKIRTTEAGVNSSGEVHIYMAFAENPFVTSTGVPVCAR